MLDRDAEEAGDLREAQFVGRPHAAFPRRPLLRGNAERFGAFFPAAAFGELFHAAGADVGGDDLPELFRYFPHDDANQQKHSADGRRLLRSCPALNFIAKSNDALIMNCSVFPAGKPANYFDNDPAKPLRLCSWGCGLAVCQWQRLTLRFADTARSRESTCHHHTLLFIDVNTYLLVFF